MEIRSLIRIVPFSVFTGLALVRKRLFFSLITFKNIQLYHPRENTSLFQLSNLLFGLENLYKDIGT